MSPNRSNDHETDQHRCSDPDHPTASDGGMSRRSFLTRAGLSTLGAVGLGVMETNLGAIQAAAQAASRSPAGSNDLQTGYKALVAVLLAGGNDSFNMLVPGVNPPSPTAPPPRTETTSPGSRCGPPPSSSPWTKRAAGRATYA